MIAWFAGPPLALKIVLGGLGALLLLWLLWLLWLRKYLEWQNVKTLEIEERVALKIEFIKTAAQIVGGLFFILTILVAYWNYQVSQKNLEATQKKNEADREQAQEKQITELYVKAIGQLGSDKLPVILGGIYALERIAWDSSKKDKGPILEVLTAYVRQNASWPPEDPAEARKRRPWTKKGRKVASQAKESKPGAGRQERRKLTKGSEASQSPTLTSRPCSPSSAAWDPSLMIRANLNPWISAAPTCEALTSRELTWRGRPSRERTWRGRGS